MSLLDLLVFAVFVVGVVVLGLWQGNREAPAGESGASDYFLAGRGLTWWLVGISLLVLGVINFLRGLAGSKSDRG